MKSNTTFILIILAAMWVVIK